ncbi:GntR family transcriptional regulator [Rhabdaerophilum calidifontis]|uniref:GntR family transcriptional regulator n=1 Tax=Rhabdaerophilum calidifontis TaxID=2604328 RepID=UPI001FE2A38C|nr:GntR family transcriptional regulator [Rhabdaerophilum calidifontis]
MQAPLAAPIPIRMPSATRVVTEELRQAIVRLEFPPGTRLSEGEIASRYNVSRQPVREALISLSRIGLVQVLPQRGTLVTRISTRHMKQVIIAREALETAVVARACERFDPMIRASIDSILETQARAAAEGDHLTITAADTQFHGALASGVDCDMIWQMVLDVKVHMDRVRHLTLQDRESMRVLVQQHRAIVAAIDARDPERADRAMRTHLVEILRDLPRVLAERSDYFE